MTSRQTLLDVDDSNLRPEVRICSRHFPIESPYIQHKIPVINIPMPWEQAAAVCRDAGIAEIEIERWRQFRNFKDDRYNGTAHSSHNSHLPGPSVSLPPSVSCQACRQNQLRTDILRTRNTQLKYLCCSITPSLPTPLNSERLPCREELSGMEAELKAIARMANPEGRLPL